MSERTCGECRYLAMGKVWGSCECPIPAWIMNLINEPDFIQPFDTQASSCACFSPKEEK